MSALAQGPPALSVKGRLGGFGISCDNGDDRLNEFGVELSRLPEECGEAVMQALEMDSGPRRRPNAASMERVEGDATIGRAWLSASSLGRTVTHSRPAALPQHLYGS